MNFPMIARRFAELAEAYGGEIARWPAAEREAAHALLVVSGDAQAALRDAQALDAGLALPAPEAPGPALRAALLRSAPRARGTAWHEAWSWRLALPALVLSLTLGVGLGFAVAPTAQADDVDEDVLALAQLDDTYTEYADP